MKKAIEIKASGIKCDACDWKDMNISYDEYDNWLNEPCPKCGANLLTKADYRTIKFIMSLVKIINKFIPISDNKKMVKRIIEMNGTGSVDFKIQEENRNE